MFVFSEATFARRRTISGLLGFVSSTKGIASSDSLPCFTDNLLEQYCPLASDLHLPRIVTYFVSASGFQ
jgi:hypothetical protein